MLAFISVKNQLKSSFDNENDNDITTSMSLRWYDKKAGDIEVGDSTSLSTPDGVNMADRRARIESFMARVCLTFEVLTNPFAIYLLDINCYFQVI
jgi:hypothetical protein